jgi:hypothetical protein
MTIRAQHLDTEAALDILINDRLIRTRTAIPAIITNVNDDNTVDVQVVIQQMIRNQDLTLSYSDLPLIKGVPVCVQHAASFGLSITVPYDVGDQCFLIIADRSIDNWQEEGGVQPPVETTEPRHHDLTDAVALIGLLNTTQNISNYNRSAIEIRNNDQSVLFKLDDSGIAIEGNVTINGDLDITGETNGVFVGTFNGVTLISTGPPSIYLNAMGVYD